MSLTKATKWRSSETNRVLKIGATKIMGLQGGKGKIRYSVNVTLLLWSRCQVNPPLFPGRPGREWPSPGRCTGGSWVPRTGRPCRKPGRRCRGPAERGSPPRRPGGRGKTNRGWKRMGWGRGLTTATPSSVPLQSAPYENNENPPTDVRVHNLAQRISQGKCSLYLIFFI